MFARSADRPETWQRALYVPLTLLAWLAVFLAVGWLLGHVVRTLGMVAFGAVLAFALAPLVTFLSRWWRRPFAVAAAYVLAIAVVVVLGTLLAVVAAGQVINLVASLPGYAREVRALQPQITAALAPLGVTPATVQSANQQLFGDLERVGSTVATSSFSVAGHLFEDVLDAILVLILSIYFTAAGPRVVRWLADGTPARLQPHARFAVRLVDHVVVGYIRGTLTMALLIGTLVGVGLTLFGIRYAVLLGVVAFFMAFVPVIGTFISGAISLVVALPHGIITAALVLGYFIIIHIIEGDVVGPRVVGGAIGIHPATGLIALLAGTELFGVAGALLAAPVAGLLQALLVELWHEYVADGASVLVPAPATAQNPQTPRAEATEVRQAEHAS
jgi:predicted PurR-regulated permease PerM